MCPKSTGEGHWSRNRVHLTNSCQPASLKEQGCAAPALLSGQHQLWKLLGTQQLTTNCTWGCSDSPKEVFLFSTCLGGTPSPIQGLCCQGKEAIQKWDFPQLQDSEKHSLTTHFPAGPGVTQWISHPLCIFEFIIIPPTAAFSVAE